MSRVCEWEPGTWYGEGSIVVYQSVKYKIIQPHTSEAGWEPPMTPALWGRMQEEYDAPPQPGYDTGQARQGGDGYGDGYNPSYIQPGQPQPQSQPPQPQYQPPPPQQDQDYGEKKRWDEHQEQQVEIHEEERKKRWYDLDEHRKKQLEVGGGLAAGLAAMGAGYYAYQHHKKSDEEKKAQVWGLQNWLQEAEARTRDFYNKGPRGPVTWVLTEGTKFPDSAIPAGQQRGQPLFICRGFYEGGIQIGKVSPASEKGAVIGYAHHEIQLPKYEVLVGDPRALRWVEASGRLDVRSLGARPVEGGREADGTPLFVAKVHLGEAVIPGKVSEKLSGAVVPVNNSETVSEHYKVLCYA